MLGTLSNKLAICIVAAVVIVSAAELSDWINLTFNHLAAMLTDLMR
jgi:Flp pilus assembly pilin Flp